MMGIENNVKAVVSYDPAVIIQPFNALAVQKNCERLRKVFFPVVFFHFFSIGQEPGNIFNRCAFYRLTVEPLCPAKNRVVFPQLNQCSRKIQQISICCGPIEPGNLVVLTISIVISQLRSSQVHRRQRALEHPEIKTKWPAYSASACFSAQ